MIEFRILGPLEVVDRGRRLPIGEGLQPALLALLLLNADQVVSSSRLIDELWGERPPPTAPKMLQKYVSQLRKALGQSDGATDQVELLVTRGHGYMLRLAGAELDAITFNRLVTDARRSREAGDVAGPADALERALALWRGDALEDFASWSFAQADIARLEEARLAAQEERIDADLALGRHANVVSELETLVARHPLREGLRAQLMLALYRSGRQAEALAVYRDTFRVLGEELGIEPSAELQRLEHAILVHDVSLQPPSSTEATASVRLTGAESATATSVPIRWVAAGVGLAVLLVSIAAITAQRLSMSAPPEAMASSTAPLVPRAPTVLARIPVDLPAGFGFGFDSVWVAGHHDRTLSRIDPETNELVEQISGIGFQANAVLVAAGSVWVSSADGLYRIDPNTNRITATIEGSGGSLAWGFLNLWETTLDDRLIRIDLRSNEIVATVPLGSGSVDWANELAIGFGSVWVAVADEHRLLRIDPGTNNIIEVIEGFGDTYSGMPIAIGEGAVWILKVVGDTATLFRIDPQTNTVTAQTPVGTRPASAPTGRVAVGGGWVWTGNPDGTISQVDPDTNEVLATLRLDSLPQDLDFGFGSLWVDSYDASQVWRIEPSL